MVLVGIVLTTLKWAFDLDEIGYWTLVALAPGVLLTWIGSRKEMAERS